MDLLAAKSDADIQNLIKGIDTKQFCFLILGLSENDKKKVFAQLSDNAKALVNADVLKLEEATKNIHIG